MDQITREDLRIVKHDQFLGIASRALMRLVAGLQTRTIHPAGTLQGSAIRVSNPGGVVHVEA